MGNVPFRCQVRLTLSDLDRGVYGQRTLVCAQNPDEPDEHILLRFLAHVLFYDDALTDRSGFTDLHEPDLQALDLTGDLVMWVECGYPPMKRVIRALGHHKAARFLALFVDREEAERFRVEVTNERPRHLEHLEIHLIDPAFMQWLETVGSRNMAWSVTMTEGTIYLESDGQLRETTVERVPVFQKIALLAES